MTVREERARFCDSCNAVIGWYASFCDECGMRVGEAEATGRSPRPQGREAPSVERDLYRAHMRLIHRFREQSERLKKECDRLTRSVRAVEERPRAPENVRKLLGLSERLLDLEQDWGDIQHRYNSQSEGIEEEFLSRIEELEADLELSPDHQAAVEEEVRKLLDSLEEGEQKLRETGRFLDVVRARQRSGVLGLGGGARATMVLGVLALLLALGGAAWGLLVARIPVRALAPSLVPAWVGLCLLFLHARARRPT